MQRLTTSSANITMAMALAGVPKEIKNGLKSPPPAKVLVTDDKPPYPNRLTPYGVTKKSRVNLQFGIFLLQYKKCVT